MSSTTVDDIPLKRLISIIIVDFTVKMATYTEGQLFKQENYSSIALEKGEYEACSFEQCDFSSADLTGVKFIDCAFTECNLSLAKLRSAALRDVEFTGCKLVGVLFEEVNPLGFSVSFQDCALNHSSFFQLTLKNSKFDNCSMLEVDFSECDLTGSLFATCELMDAKFERTNLEKCDFSSSRGFIIHPTENKLKGAKFSRDGLIGLVSSFGINVVD